MAADDLTRPLGRKSKTPGRSFPFRQIAMATMAALALIAGGWLIMVDDPNGGEPVAVVPLDQAVPETVDPTTVAAVSPADADGPINPNDVVIRDASAGGDIRLFTEAVDGLLERTPHGMVPRIGSSGIRPVDAYARPETDRGGANTARIAVVLTGLGRDDDATVAALNRLPGAASLAFSPYGGDLDRWVERARDSGHEVLLEISSAATGEGANPAGPRPLVAAASPAENVDSLYWMMSRMTRYAGVVGAMDRSILADTKKLEPIVAEIAARGLLYVDDGAIAESMAPELATGQTPIVIGDIRIAADDPLALIERQFQELEAMALERGSAVGVIAATPMTVEALVRWTGRLRQRGIHLVPVTALARG